MQGKQYAGLYDGMSGSVYLLIEFIVVWFKIRKVMDQITLCTVKELQLSECKTKETHVNLKVYTY